MRTNDTLLELLLELQVLDRVPRMGYVMRGVTEAESIAEHTFHVAFLVWALAPRIPEVDAHRAVELALLHDLAEVRTGDLPMTAARYFPDGAKTAAEGAAFEELLAPFGERAGALIAELEERASSEARLVKACDKLQLMLKVAAYQRWGAGGLDEFWENEANFPSGEFEPVREIFDQLRAWKRSRDADARAGGAGEGRTRTGATEPS